MISLVSIDRRIDLKQPEWLLPNEEQLEFHGALTSVDTVRTVEHWIADGVGHSRGARVEAQRRVVRFCHTVRQVHRALVRERVHRHREARRMRSGPR